MTSTLNSYLQEEAERPMSLQISTEIATRPGAKSAKNNVKSASSGPQRHFTRFGQPSAPILVPKANPKGQNCFQNGSWKGPVEQFGR